MTFETELNYKLIPQDKCADCGSRTFCYKEIIELWNKTSLDKQKVNDAWNDFLREIDGSIHLMHIESFKINCKNFEKKIGL